MSDKERRNSPEKLALAALDEMDLIELDDEDHDGLMTIWRDMIAKYIRAAVAEAEARVREEEREACAKLADNEARPAVCQTPAPLDSVVEGWIEGARTVAAAIRARGRQA